MHHGDLILATVNVHRLYQGLSMLRDLLFNYVTLFVHGHWLTMDQLSVMLIFGRGLKDKISDLEKLELEFNLTFIVTLDIDVTV